MKRDNLRMALAAMDALYGAAASRAVIIRAVRTKFLFGPDLVRLHR
jgi:hypothetical protein